MTYPYETIPIEKKDAKTVHVLTGTVTKIDTLNTKVDVNIDDYAEYEAIPVFYHCEGSETAEGLPFFVGDKVIIVNHGDTETLSVADMKVVGFEDGLPRYCPIETVYVSMTVGTTVRCFVWDASGNTFASINKNDGEPASFPCDPSDISDWLSEQTGVGSSLFTTENCGRDPFYSPEVQCPAGNWGTAGSVSDSKEEPSNCGCDFIDTGVCETTWDTTTKCYWAPDTPGYEDRWIWSGTYILSRNSHILWDGGNQAKKLTYLNGSGVESAFRIELNHNLYETRWSADGAACGGEPCDNIRLYSGIYSNTYKFHTPLEKNILEINHTRTSDWDICNDLGAYSEHNYLSSPKMSNLGTYSEKIIAQIYAVEARTVTRVMNGSISDDRCVGGDCTWISEEYTASGLKITAQVGTFENTDGVDPTRLSRNASFESIITGMYGTLRTLESIAEDNIANATISMSIYRGVI